MKKSLSTIAGIALGVSISSLALANSQPKIIIDPTTNKILIQTWGQTLSLEQAKALSTGQNSTFTGAKATTLSGIVATGTNNTGNIQAPKPQLPEIKKGTENWTEIERAISWMYANGLTQYNTLSGYRPADPVLREESAKIIAQAYRILGYPQETKNTQCKFSDEKSFNTTLSGFIAESCKWGIFKGANGEFLPYKTLSKAEALTVLMRIFERNSSNENFTPRWTMYFVKAKAIGLTKEGNVNTLDRPTSREELALLIYRFKNLILNKDQNSSAKSQLNNVNQNPTSFLQNYLTGSIASGTNTTWANTNNPILSLLSGGNESSSSLSILNNPEITEAMHRMKEYGLTNASDISTYNPFEYLTREQAAKMLVQFAKIENFKAISGTNSNCEFKDVKYANGGLATSIQQACQLGLMQGNNWLFSPGQTLAKSEFITLLIRLAEGKKLDENQNPWWKNYFVKARELGLINNDDALAIQSPITRYETALIFYRFWIKQKILSNLNTSQLKNELISTVKGADGEFLNTSGNYSVSIDANLLKNQFFQEGFVELLGQRYKLKKTNLTTFDIANESFVRYGDLFAINNDSKIGNINIIVSNGNIIDGNIRLFAPVTTWRITPNEKTTAWFYLKKN